MPTVADLLADPALGPLSLLPTAGRGGRRVARVAFAERLRDVEIAPPDSFVILGRGASEQADSYRFDVTVRRAADSGVAALTVLAHVAALLPRSALSVAAREDVAIVPVPDDLDPAELAAAVNAALMGDAHASVQLAARGLAALERIHAEEAGLEGALEALSHVLPGIGLREPSGDDLAVPLIVDGVQEGTLCCSTPSTTDPTRALLLRAAAGVVAAVVSRSRRMEEAPIRSRTELLTELLALEPGRDSGLLRRARQLGLRVDGWHTAALVDAGLGGAADEVHRFELNRAAERVALQAARGSGGTWHLARSEEQIVLVSTSERDPGARAVPAVARAAAAVLRELRSRFAELSPRAGVGATHLGPAGLRASVAEARTALAGAGPDAAAVFDAAGLRAMLAEWYATDTARRSVQTLLEPLSSLGRRRADEAIRTLQVFLDEQGSVSRTARRLHLHRNAVAYRIRRIFDLLDVDRDDPDARLALQLACRARLLP